MMSEKEIIDEQHPSLAHNLKGHRRDVTHLSFHPDGNQLVSGSADHSIMLWKLNSPNQRCYKFSGHTNSVNCVEFSTDGELMVSCSNDQTVRLWIPKIQGTSYDFRAHSSAVNTVVFSPENDKILTGSNDKTIKLWDTKKRKFITSFTGHTNWVNCAKFAIDESFIASCGDDKTLRIWDIKSGHCVHTFTCSKSSGNHLAIHSNAHSVAVAMGSGSVRLYDLRSKKLQQHYVLHDNTTSIDWHPTANYFLTSGLDKTLKIVDVMEGRPLYTLTGHISGVRCAKFSKNGENFGSGGKDKHILIWNTNSLSLKTFKSESGDSLSR